MESPDGKFSTVIKEISGKIILIDDEKYEKHLLEEALNKKNWNVKVEYFTNAEDALVYMKNTRDELFLIISDMNMLKMNGLELKKAIDNDDVLRKKAMPFIFATNITTIEQIAEAYEYRVQGFFKKPMNIEEQAEMFDIILKYWIICRHPNKKDI
jgi:DNA-binding NtrC family response regulator